MKNNKSQKWKFIALFILNIVIFGFALWIAQPIIVGLCNDAACGLGVGLGLHAFFIYVLPPLTIINAILLLTLPPKGKLKVIRRAFFAVAVCLLIFYAIIFTNTFLMDYWEDWVSK